MTTRAKGIGGRSSDTVDLRVRLNRAKGKPSFQLFYDILREEFEEEYGDRIDNLIQGDYQGDYIYEYSKGKTSSYEELSPSKQESYFMFVTEAAGRDHDEYLKDRYNAVIKGNKYDYNGLINAIKNDIAEGWEGGY